MLSQAASKESHPYCATDLQHTGSECQQRILYCSFEREEVSPEGIDLTAGDSNYSESSDE
jgi:hypothetical protein